MFCSYEKTASRTCHGCVDAIRASQGRLAISSYEQDTTVRSSPFWPRGGVVDFFGKGNNRAKMHLSSPSLFCAHHTHRYTCTILYSIARAHISLCWASAPETQGDTHAPKGMDKTRVKQRVCNFVSASPGYATAPVRL